MDKFSELILEAVRWRVDKLHQLASKSPLPPQSLVVDSLEPMGTAWEKMEMALLELQQQNSELSAGWTT